MDPPAYRDTGLTKSDVGVTPRILFAGSNEHTEVESLTEFLLKAPCGTALNAWNFQAVDFSALDRTIWDSYNWEGATFLGCVFPAGITAASCRAAGCYVYENPTGVPFIAFRAKMYTTLEMDKIDLVIGDYYRDTQRRNFNCRMAEAMHDFSIRDAMYDYLEGKTPISVMGSHSLLRASHHYEQLVRLSRKLAQNGFLVVTGGGNGAMEAANLGAYLANHSEEDVNEALQIIRTGNENVKFEFLHPVPAQNVIKRFGWPTYMPSLGIPTWRYSQEPFNRFATYHAKFFSNAQREDSLCHIARGTELLLLSQMKNLLETYWLKESLTFLAGTIFGEGGPGTRQEIFQAACVNAEQADITNRCPLVFFGSEFYHANGIYDVVVKNYPGQDILLTDDIDQTVAHLIEHSRKIGLPLRTDLEYLKEE